MLASEHSELAVTEQVLLRDVRLLGKVGQVEPHHRSKSKLERSRQIVRARKSHALDFRYPDELPVSHALDRIAASVDKHQVTIVVSGTGSGKSTQIPKRCLQMGFGIHGQIGHTQPRRIAARSVAARIAEETKTQLGRAIGSHVRFDKSFADESRLKVMTDGILLEEIRHDPLLLQYDLLIIDEVHERSCNIDFLLGYLAKIRPRRPDLKVILMSATADQDTLKNAFTANVVDVPGKQFAVDVRYAPYDEDEQSELEAIDAALQKLPQSDDVLVFLPGEREILDAQRYLEGRGYGGTKFLPLFGRMTAQAQSAVFEPGNQRRIILATNVAETSLTIPGVRNVVDTGTARISRYNPRSKLLELPISEISQAAAKQRAGRCGREAPGVCIRLYGEENYDAREEFTKPEILRTSLASSILRCAVLQLGDLAEFPLPDTPSQSLIKDGVSLLKEINALDRQQKITATGRQLAKLPIDPRLGRFLLAAAELGQYDFALTISAAISVGDCRLRPIEHRKLADSAHAEFNHRDSDLLSYVNLWKAIQDKIAASSRGEIKKFCKQNFLSFARIKQWEDLRRQLHREGLALRLETRSDELNYKKIHQAFLVGFASLIGVKDESGDYRGAHGIKFKIHPRSTIRERKPKYITCLERFETSTRYADMVAKIEPSWVVKAAPHLIKNSYSAPYWDSKRGKAFAFQTQRLFGMTLGSDKRVAYGAINMARSRALLIEHALVRFELENLPGFLIDNYQTLSDIRRLEQKVRRQLIPGDKELFDFYDARLPENIVTINALQKWVERGGESDDALLYEVENEILKLQKEAALQYPDVLVFGDYEFKAKYLFDPTQAKDGITLIVEKPILGRLPATAFEALCPGLLQEKLVALAKSLPKALRMKISPIASFVTEVVDRVGTDSVANVFSRHFLTKSGEPLSPDFVKSLHLPTHLTAHVEIVDAYQSTQIKTQDGLRPAVEGRFYPNLVSAKQAELDDEEGPVSARSAIFTRWQLHELPASEETRIGNNRIVDYLAFVDKGDGVTVGRFTSAEVAAEVHRHGVARLASLASGVGSRKSVLPGFDHQDVLLMCASLGLNTSALQEIRKAAYLSILSNTEVPRTVRAFDELMDAHASTAESLAGNLSLQLAELVAEAYRIQRLLSAQVKQRWPEVYSDISRQITYLFSVPAFGMLDRQMLKDYSRYLTGMQRRIERLGLSPRKDSQKANIVSPVIKAWDALWEKSDSVPSGTFSLYFEVEEVRLKQFAPELATNRKINLQALTKEISAQLKVSSIGP